MMNNFLHCIKSANDYDENGNIINHCFVIICPNIIYAEELKSYKCALWDKHINYKTGCFLQEGVNDELNKK